MQISHTVLPSDGVNFPGAHTLQMDIDCLSPYVPAGHELQFAVEGWPEYFPGGHALQVVAAYPEIGPYAYCPGLHCSHTEAPVKE